MSRYFKTKLLFLGIVTLFLTVCAKSQNSETRMAGWKTNLEKRSVDLNELISGGPSKDGIPALTDPKFVSVGEAAEWLKPNEPVISLEINGEARAYPLQILIWHEIVNDKIGGQPVAVTFCPLCYTAISFDRRLDGKVYTFGVSGMLRHSDMIMYDRQTESWWQQFSGEAIVGDLTGEKLKQIPSQIVGFGQFAEAFPDGKVLSKQTGYKRDYGRNPYVGYDDIGKSPFLFKGKTDNRLRPMEKLVTVTIGNEAKAYPYTITRKKHVIHDRIGSTDIVIFHADGAASALDAEKISESKTDGSTGVFIPEADGQKLTFYYENGLFFDKQTKTRWNILGRQLKENWRANGSGKSLTAISLPLRGWFISRRPKSFRKIEVLQVKRRRTIESNILEFAVRGGL